MGASVVQSLLGLSTFGAFKSGKKVKKEKKKRKAAQAAASAADKRADAVVEASAIEKFNVASGLAQPTSILSSAPTTGRGTILGN